MVEGRFCSGEDLEEARTCSRWDAIVAGFFVGMMKTMNHVSIGSENGSIV